MSNNVRYFPDNELPNKTQIIKEHGKFIDLYFKPEDESIFGKNNISENFKDKREKKIEFKWTRIFRTEKLFSIDENDDIYKGLFSEDKCLNETQGCLGNFYLITYLHNIKKSFLEFFIQ